ncbi:MAG: PatB family C-S lyase [Clostridiaceae bacterium]
MEYNFDEIIDRKGTNAMNTDGFKEYIFHDPDIKLPFKDDEFIRMWVADMEFAVPPEIIEAIRKRLDRKILGYTKVFAPEYYKAFSGWVQRYYGWSFKKEHLVTSNGIVPALYELVGHICKPDNKVLILTPSYAYFKHSANFNKIRTVYSELIEENGFYTMDFEDIEKKARDEKVNLCIFCNPHNPTGRTWTNDELLKFGRICLDNGLFIISDEIHCDLLRTGITHTPLAKLFPETDRIITCMAPSKTFNLAGLTISNVIIPNDRTRKIWEKRHYSMDNPLSIAAAQAAYTECDDWLKQLKAYLDGNFEFIGRYLVQNLPKAVFHIPESTYFAWVNISAYVSEEKNLPLYFAQNAGVLLEDGKMFLTDSYGYIRLNLACPRSILEEGLKRICNLLNS